MGIHWQDQLSVGNDSIDNDHKHLIELINDVQRALEGKDTNHLANLLRDLIHYSSVHFESEEKIAKAVGFPDSERIHQSHGELAQSLLECQDNLAHRWSDELAKEVAALLRTWLIDHVIKEDLRMKPYLTQHSPKLVAT